MKNKYLQITPHLAYKAIQLTDFQSRQAKLSHFLPISFLYFDKSLSSLWASHSTAGSAGERFVLAFVDGVGGILLSVHCKRPWTEWKHSGLGQGSCPSSDEGRGLLLPAGPAGWLPESSGVRSRQLVAAAAQWGTCPQQPQGFGGAADLALCRDCAENSPPLGENKSTFCDETSVWTGFPWEEFILIYVCLGWLSALDLWQSRPLPAAMGCFSEKPQSSALCKRWPKKPVLAGAREKIVTAILFLFINTAQRVGRYNLIQQIFKELSYSMLKDWS